MVVVVGRLNTKAGQVAEKLGKTLRDQQSCVRGYVGVEFLGQMVTLLARHAWIFLSSRGGGLRRTGTPMPGAVDGHVPLIAKAALPTLVAGTTS
jgi:hypothetical protein